MIYNDFLCISDSSDKNSKLLNGIKTLKILLFILLIIAPLSQLYADQTDLIFDKISAEDGLSQNDVITIGQDSLGFLWFATQDGLNRYDGINCKVFRNSSDDPNSLPDNRIRVIFNDGTGDLWIGSEGGLSRYNRGEENFTNFSHNDSDPDSLGHNTVRAIYEDSSGNLWIGTRGGGLNLFDRKTERFVRYVYNPEDENSISDNEISSINEDKAGHLWVGTFRGGVNRFDFNTGKFKRFQHNPADVNSLSHNKILAISIDFSGTVWVGTFGGGLNRFNPNTEIFNRVNNISKKIRALYLDNNQQLWVGSNEGLFIWDEETDKLMNFRNIPNNSHSLRNDTVNSIFKDNSGIVWIGTADGINKIVRQTAFKTYKNSPENSNSLSNNDINSIFEDSSGMLWIGTAQGLNTFNIEDNVFLNYRHDPDNPGSISSDEVKSVLEDSTGNFWIGTYGGGLNKFNTETGVFTHFMPDQNDENSISGAYIWDIREDCEENIWVGTNLSGLNKIEKSGKIHHFRHSPDDLNSLSSDRIWTIFMDHEGELWLGTYGGGLNHFNREDKTFTRFLHDPDNPESISNNVILSMYEDENHNLWIGTLGGGLNKFDRKEGSFSSFTTENGLSNDVIKGILEDESGNLWLSSNSGISRFNPENNTIRNYGLEDGLPGKEFNKGASCKTSQELFIFGGVRGMTSFSPENFIDNTFLPPVVLTSITQDGNRIFENRSPDSLTSIDLPWQQNYLEFEFSVLNYIQPEKNQYAYMMEGLDKGWYYSGLRNGGRYSAIPPGSYILKMKGSNNDGLWNEEGVSIRVNIARPFWLKWEFYTLLGSILAAIIIFIIHSQFKAKTNKLLAEQAKHSERETMALNEELEKNLVEKEMLYEEIKKQLSEKEIILTEVHHRIKNNINSIRLILSMQAESVSNKEALSILKDAIGRIESMQILYEKLLYNDDYHLISLKDYLDDLTDEIIRLFPDASKVTIKKELCELQLSPKNVSAIGIIVNELLTNIMKYSFLGRETGLIEVKLKSAQSDQSVLTIQDDGNGLPEGFDVSESKGFGLRIVSMLSQQVGGSFTIKNNNGTLSTLTLKK